VERANLLTALTREHQQLDALAEVLVSAANQIALCLAQNALTLPCFKGLMSAVGLAPIR
jgi:hypothetical protein